MGIKKLQDKKILILGMGREGKDALTFLLEKFPEKKIGIADKKRKRDFKKDIKKIITQNKERLNLHLGENYLDSFSNYDLIIKSPGIPPHKIESRIKKDTILTSGTQLFLENCPGEVVGITATKGKSTTATLIYRILKNNRVRSHLVGNIGTPALSLLKEAKKGDIFVYELSSHQLYQIKNSPHIAVFLNIYPEHLNWHGAFENYFNSKANITRHQTKKDYFIFNSKIKKIEDLSKETKAKKIPIEEEKFGVIWQAFKESNFPADFYFLNVKAATEVGKLYDIPEEKIAKEIKNFKTLEHRLEKVGIYKGITFYNDSIATNPIAVIAALSSLGDRVDTLIAGGYKRKGVKFNKLGEKVVEKNISNLILFPPTGKEIWEAVPNSKQDNINKFDVESMKEAVKISYKNTKKGKICLLSCASASFGVFKNYKERGSLFKKYVKEIGKK